MQNTYFQTLSYYFFLLLLFSNCNTPQATTTTLSNNSIEAKTSGMEKMDGYFPFYWDAKTGKIWLEINRLNTEFLYVNSS